MADCPPKYIKTMFKQMRHLERKYEIREHFLARQIQINGTMRRTLIDWLVDVHRVYELFEETFQLSVAILDRYLQEENTVQTDKFQLVGITALFIASKYEEVCPLFIGDVLYVTHYTYTKTEIIEFEREMLRKLRYGLTRPVPLNFLARFTDVSNSSPKEQHLALYLVNLSLLEDSMSHYKPSELAAAALCLSLYLLSKQDEKSLASVWTPTLAMESRYLLDHIEPIIIKIAKVATETCILTCKAVHKKFARIAVSRVAHQPELKGPALRQLAMRAQELQGLPIPIQDIPAAIQDIPAPIQYIQAPIQDIQAPIQVIQAPIQNLSAPSQKEQGPSQEEQGPSQERQRKRQAGPNADPEVEIPATRRRFLNSLDGLQQIILVNRPVDLVTSILIPATIQCILVHIAEQF